jgi:hypothetical protein
MAKIKRLWVNKDWSGRTESAISIDGIVKVVDRNHNNRLIGLTDKNLGGTWHIERQQFIIHDKRIRV